MGRPSRCGVALVSLLLLFFLSPAAATIDVTESEQVVYSFGGRRGLLQAVAPVTPPDAGTPPVDPSTPPVQPTTPPPQTATPPSQTATPAPVEAAKPPTQTGTPTPTPPTPNVASPTGGMNPVLPPTGIITPAPAPIPLAPAPAPIGVTSGQKRNAIIAVSVVGGIIIIGAVLIFCRCQCGRRGKKMPFQRLQMT